MDETTRGGVQGAFRTLRLWVAGLPTLWLIVLIGVAPTYPAEFVIFRIGQWTADRKV